MVFQKLVVGCRRSEPKCHVNGIAISLIAMLFLNSSGAAFGEFQCFFHRAVSKRWVGFGHAECVFGGDYSDGRINCPVAHRA